METDVSNLASLAAHPNLRRMMVTESALIGEINLSGLASLKELTLGGNPITSIVGLNSLTQLTDLVLDNTDLTVLPSPLAHSLLMFEAELPSPVNLPAGEGFFSVYVPNTQNGCRFYWATADIGDGRSHYFDSDIAELDWTELEDDVAFCLVTSNEPEGECDGPCDPEGEEPNPLLECTGTVAQLPDRELTATFFSSNNGAGLQVYDRVSGANAPITAVRWWGVTTQGSGNCDPATQIYTVEFAQDGLTYPGGGIVNVPVTPTITDTGTTLGGFPLYVFDAELPEPVTLPGGNGYISVHVPSTTNNCRFAWANADLGDGGAVAFVSGALTWEFPADDVAWCLTLEQAEGEGEEGEEGEGEDGCIFPLSGDQQEGEVETSATGTGRFITDGGGNLVGIRVEHNVQNVTMAHIHTGAAGVNGGVIINFTDLVSPIEHTFTPQEVALLRNTAAFYVNIHSTLHGSGEIRGQAEQCLPAEPTEGEGVVDGEGGIDGEEGEGVIDGEGGIEGEGEPLDEVEQSLYSFASADTSGNGKLTLAELQSQIPGVTQEEFDALDQNNDDELSVAELLDVNGVGIIHSGDFNGDFVIALNELLRMIQLYNAGSYSCAANAGVGEDGYITGDGPIDCVLHALDQDLNGEISLSELLRGIQLYNLEGYQFCEGQSEDGFCAQD